MDLGLQFAVMELGKFRSTWMDLGCMDIFRGELWSCRDIYIYWCKGGFDM